MPSLKGPELVLRGESETSSLEDPRSSTSRGQTRSSIRRLWRTVRGGFSQEGASEIPALAEKLGVNLLATYVPMNNHMVFAAVEAKDMNSVHEFAFQSRPGQWNTLEIYQVSTPEEALTKINELPTIYK